MPAWVPERMRPVSRETELVEIVFVQPEVMTHFMKDRGSYLFGDAFLATRG